MSISTAKGINMLELVGIDLELIRADKTLQGPSGNLSEVNLKEQGVKCQGPKPQGRLGLKNPNLPTYI